ncbi:N-formylglutamate amidohydrolase [Methyloraptor flagellatus]|uniref:N-formylglutamate amidohydrolase n=1 Tax=Methyloraptor flagellatus TaxID=3162530 RepID=A0AAU7X9D0_9HYPH
MLDLPPADPSHDAYEIIPGDPGLGVVIVADHASNRIPPEYADLGLPRRELERHIGYDIGVAMVVRELARRMGVPAVLSTFSRLLIDPNRGADDPTLVMRLSDGAIVPGNARIGAEEKNRRIARFWRPYHTAVAGTIEAALASGRPPVVLSVHSFTPVWRGWPRPWHVGVLWDNDPRLPDRLLSAFRADPDLVVGDNEPYSGVLRGDSMFQHGTELGLAHAIVEIRQDLIADAPGALRWAERLAAVMERLVGAEDLHVQRFFGSRSGPVTPRF